jgi:hypothetical protein
LVKHRTVDSWKRAEKDAARTILLDVSPFEVDGGELIGRDPRQISVEDFTRAGIDSAAILAVIRAKCLDCCVEQPEEVRKCVALTCPNWPYRMGVNPFHKQNISEEERTRRSERMKARNRPAEQSVPMKGMDASSSNDPPDGDIGVTLDEGI